MVAKKLTAQERKIKLEKEHNLIFMKEIGGMTGMCNLSQGIVEDTMMETILSSIDKLMKNLEKLCNIFNKNLC